MKKSTMLGCAAAVLLAIGLTGCTDPEGTRRTATAFGFTDIEVTGRPGFFSGCGERDTYATAFEATNPQGLRVRGVVCSGGWGGKLGTVRIDDIIGRAAEPVLIDPTTNITI